MTYLTRLSLLGRVREPRNEDAWAEFAHLYGPLVEGWLARMGVAQQDAADLRQEVMTKLLDALPEFEHNGRPGAFRNWLRSITANRLRTFRRQQFRQTQARGGSDFALLAEQLADDDSVLTRQWNAEYEQMVVRRLLQIVERQFSAASIQAFRRVVLKGEKAAEVAADLGLTLNAVRIAQSRVLRALREAGEGLID